MFAQIDNTLESGEMPDMTLGEAAKVIGVSVDTLRRWDRQGRVQTTRDARNRRLVPPAEVARLRRHPPRHAAVMRCGPAWISTSAITPETSTETTRPGKRLRAESRPPASWRAG